MTPPDGSSPPLLASIYRRSPAVVCRAMQVGSNIQRVLEDPRNGKFYRLGPAEAGFWLTLDGQRNGFETAALGDSSPNKMPPLQAEALVGWLLHRALIEPIDASRHAATSSPSSTTWGLGKLLALRIPLVNPDPLLERITPWFSPCFSRGGGWLLSLLFVAGLAKWLIHAGWQGIPATLLDQSRSLQCLAIWLGLKMMHEMAHGVACKHFGGEAPCAGVMLWLGMPLAYIDVTSSWRCARTGERIVVASAGMIVELAVAACAVLLWTPGSLTSWDRTCLDVATIAGLNTLLFNLHPCARFDGYFILSDWLGRPNLYAQGRRALVEWLWPRAASEHVERRPPCWLALYGASTWLWQVSVLASWIALGWAHVGSLAVGLGIVLAPTWFGTSWHSCGAWLRDRGKRRSPARTFFVTTIGCGVVLTALFTIPAPSVIPGMADDSGWRLIRAGGAGFVRRVEATPGTTVPQGALLIELDDPPLRQRLVAAEIALAQARQQRLLAVQAGELARSQAEAQRERSAEETVRELNGQRARLEVRAPLVGQFSGPDVAPLVGCYVEAGTPLGWVGEPAVRRIVACVPHHEAEAWRAVQGGRVSVVETGTGICRSGWLREVEPRACEEPPQRGFGAQDGGPLAVVERRECQEANFRLVEPCLVARIELDPREPDELRAGQRFWVVLPAGGGTWGARLIRWLERSWFVCGLGFPATTTP